LSTTDIADIKAFSLPENLGDDDDASYEVQNGVAVISVSGVLVKYDGLLTQLLGGVSTQTISQIFSDALDNDAVESILLVVDSPGGQVAGTADLATLIASSAKPVTAYVSDMASQCDTIIANPTACIGSIGVYCVLEDNSRLYEDAGVKVTLVKAGAYKGVGADGVPITDDQIADQQREIDGLYRIFVSSVAKGRGLSIADATKLATGQTWLASEAVKLKLIDGVDTLSNVIGGIVAKSKDSVLAADVKPEAVAVVETPAVDVPAVAVAAVVDAPALDVDKLKADAMAAGAKSADDRLAELLELAPEDPAFVLAQFKAGASVASAAKAYAAKLSADLKAERTKAAQLATLDPSDGVKSLQVATSIPSNPEADWDNNVGDVQSRFTSKRAYLALAKANAKKSAAK
jgi:signal peptide peptidase SppA